MRSPEPAAPHPAIRPEVRRAGLHAGVGGQHPDLAPRVAATITSVVVCGFFAVALSYVLRIPHSAWSLAAAVVLLAVLLGLQLFHSFPTLVKPLAPRRRWTLAAQALLTYLPFAFFKAAWLGMPGFLAASALLVVDGVLAWAIFVGTVISVGVLQFAVGFGKDELAYNVLATALTGVVVYGLSRLSDLVSEVQAARGELARLAVTQERLRFARDLHDLLGFSLSTITLKCELTHRLVLHQPQRAQQELTEVLHTARQALSDVRSVASGYRSLSLRTEACTAESILTAVGITAETRLEFGPLPDEVDTVLATVLREGITNMLRHSKADHCLIEAVGEAGSVRLRIVNDGADRTAGTLKAGTDGGGSGIGNLTERVARLGGTLIAEPAGPGRFCLAAELPLKTAVAGASGPGNGLTASPTPGLSGPRPSDS
ncbi:histidine kinase [Streptomyces sp. LHD-70]|uniref:sensor histidine kinase n=1 Tax=Streptomyces sp. LHD-70 TaxID=3072140 RepID=UPI00280C5047|nr:histidine kinase [Streptomyces sp. LHD-70]MDQ8705966.1 histidine kinase [Streptomyces sp. LHD-70]